MTRELKFKCFQVTLQLLLMYSPSRKMYNDWWKKISYASIANLTFLRALNFSSLKARLHYGVYRSKLVHFKEQKIYFAF